jgi:hypothetical protein
MRVCLAARGVYGFVDSPGGWPGVAGDSPSIGVLAVLTEAMAEVTRGAPDLPGRVGESDPAGTRVVHMPEARLGGRWTRQPSLRLLGYARCPAVSREWRSLPARGP